MEKFVSCKQVVKAYRVFDHEIVALRGIDFDMDEGEMVAIIGPSGAGKSTLLNLLGGLDNPTAGQLSVGGRNLLDFKGRELAAYRLQQVGFLWQQVEQNLLRHRSALRNVTLPMELNGVPRSKRKERAKELLDAVGVLDRANNRPAQLSGGEQQRVAIAVALANMPKLLLADEPTGALDHDSGLQVMELVGELRERYGLTVLMVTHDMEVAAYADRVLTLRDGALGQDLSEEQDAGPTLDEEGRVMLPAAVQSHLQNVDRISIEIRPEGVLLRPEVEEMDNTEAVLQDMLPQDKLPQTAGRRSLFKRFRRNSRKKADA